MITTEEIEVKLNKIDLIEGCTIKIKSKRGIKIECDLLSLVPISRNRYRIDCVIGFDDHQIFLNINVVDQKIIEIDNT